MRDDAAGGADESAQTAPRSLAESAYAAMRQQILDGGFEPGAKLRIDDLKERYNVSSSTIRVSLTRLVGEALVTCEEQRGFRVAPVSLDDFRDLTAVRILNENDALRQSIAAGDKTWEINLLTSFHWLSKVEERRRVDPAGTLSEFEKCNREFHHALLAACPSRWLHQLIGLLLQQSERYRHMAVSQRTTQRDVHAEHQAIFDAAIARDAELACKLNAEHIERTFTALRAVLESRPAEKRSAKARSRLTT